jgi:hypothetical protein
MISVGFRTPNEDAMITHAFNSPIAPEVLRVSVLADDELFAADFPTAKLSVTLAACRT